MWRSYVFGNSPSISRSATRFTRAISLRSLQEERFFVEYVLCQPIPALVSNVAGPSFIPCLVLLACYLELRHGDEPDLHLSHRVVPKTSIGLPFATIPVSMPTTGAFVSTLRAKSAGLTWLKRPLRNRSNCSSVQYLARRFCLLKSAVLYVGIW
jgi:hypothetical protein